MAGKFFISVLFSLIYLSSSLPSFSTNLQNKQLQRNIDLTTQLAKHTIELVLENVGSSPANAFHVILQNPFASKLSHFSANDKDGRNLTIVREQDSPAEYATYLVSLSQALESRGSVDVNMKMVFVHSMEPFPHEIAQNDRQLVRYSENHYWYSPYKTGTMRTKIKLSSSSVMSHSELAPTTVKNDVVVYGPYKEVVAFSNSPMTLHFENNRPFLTAKTLQRWVEVSHWGNIAVEEFYKLYHDGAKLKGSFSRYDYQMNPLLNGPTSIPTLKVFLPEVAADVYYRDDIGNISTSFLRPGNPQQIEMRPRFPLFGGWKTEFLLGYNLPTSSFLSTSYDDSSVFILNITFIPEWELQLVIDEHLLKVVLPEGATDINVHLPFEAEVIHSHHVTYLDLASVGRPVVTIRKTNVASDHLQYIQVTYRFSQRSLLFEPILLAAFFFAIFALVMFLVRVELSISQEHGAQLHDEVVKSLESLKSIFKERELLHDKLDDALQSYIRTNESTTHDRERKNAITTFPKLKKNAAKEISDIEKHEPSLAQKIQELEAKQTSKEESQMRHQNLTIQHKILKTIKTLEKFNEELEKLPATYDSMKEEIEELVEEILG